MGADLYIKSITDPANKRYEPKFNRACAARDEHIVQRQRLEMVLAQFETTGAVKLPSIAKQAKGIRAKLDAIKVQITEAQKTVERYFGLMEGRGGYFRDSYNGSSVLWRLGLSWWQDIPGGELTAAQLREALAKIKSRRLKSVTETELRENHCKVDDGENSPAAWNRMFQNKKRRLIAFFERAIEHAEKGETVYFSL